jgi:glycosyltransferase involved in cell wall biosynthesis
MEAAASGLPVIATDIRGCRQVVDDRVTGRLVPPRDARGLADAIAEYAGRPRRVEHGAAGRAKAAREFDERTVVERVLAAYGAP